MISYSQYDHYSQYCSQYSLSIGQENSFHFLGVLALGMMTRYLGTEKFGWYVTTISFYNL